MNIRNDIYYQRDYASLYTGTEKSLFTFEHRHGDAVLYNLSIKRPIKKIGSELCDEIWFDLETPYGYGGFLTNCNDKAFMQEALNKYRQRCMKERIIAEFVRFHPFNDFPVRFPDLFDMMAQDRPVVVVDLDVSTETRWKQYGPTTRNILRKGAKNLVFQPADNLKMFETLYTKTMRRNNADAFYYFDQDYYHSLLALDGVRLYQVTFDSRVIAMAFFMIGPDFAHYHLSANDTDFLKLNANYFMLDQAFEVARSQGASIFMLGGGRTPSPTDELYRFKRKFSRETRLFNIAGMVHNPAKYNDYIARWENQNPGNNMRYFLKYRLNEERPNAG